MPKQLLYVLLYIQASPKGPPRERCTVKTRVGFAAMLKNYLFCLQLKRTNNIDLLFSVLSSNAIDLIVGLFCFIRNMLRAFFLSVDVPWECSTASYSFSSTTAAVLRNFMYEVTVAVLSKSFSGFVTL
jgi:hypothetical protein